VRVALAQAGLTSIPVPAWILSRIGLAVAAAAIAWAWFGLPVLGLIAFLVVYHLVGTALEFRRRGFEARHQEALLEAVRHGIAVMSRAGNATSMLEALADGGPFEVRPLFKEIVLVGGSGPAGETFVRALEKIRDRVADPLFDDVVLALTLHWRQGGKLVPALEAVVNDWSETLRLQREAKALRSGVEASVVLLALLPFVFLVTLQLLAPTLLAPFRSPGGEVVFALAIGWMALGYGILQRMSQPPRESRLRLREALP
jgi:tight adherence protein B